MSVSLKRLRSFFNDELVVYQGGETKLTALAVILRPRIREVLQAAREVMDLSASFDPALDQGSIIITAPDVVEIILLRALSPLLTAQAPGMKLTSLPFNYQPIETMFRQPLDVAVIAEPFAASNLAKEPLFSDTLSCMVWTENRLYGDSLSETDYMSARHVGISQESERLTHPVGTRLQETYARQNTVVRASNFAALPHTIIGTDMVATVLSSYARICTQTLPVRLVKMSADMPRIDFVMQWQPYRGSEPFIRWVIALIRSATAFLRDEAA